VTYRFLSPAQRDLAEAVEYYEQASPGLGLEFLDEIERTVARVLVHPEAWTRVAEHHRRCRMRRFPYGLLYTVENDIVIIAAVMNLRRNPEGWKKRL